jgi:hypothetical protein
MKLPILKQSIPREGSVKISPAYFYAVLRRLSRLAGNKRQRLKLPIRALIL